MTAGGVARSTLRFDRSAVLRTSFVVDPTYTVPDTVGVSVDDTTGTERLPVCTVPATVHCVSGTPRLAQQVYPSSYGVWAGICTAKPASPPVVAVAPGATVDVNVRLGALQVDFKNAGGTLVPSATGRTLYVTAVGAGACAVQHVVAAAAATVKVALPSGTWQLATNATGAGAPTGGWPQVVVDASSTTPQTRTVTVP